LFIFNYENIKQFNFLFILFWIIYYMSKIIYIDSKKLYLGDMFDANNESYLNEKN